MNHEILKQFIGKNVSYRISDSGNVGLLKSINLECNTVHLDPISPSCLENIVVDIAAIQQIAIF